MVIDLQSEARAADDEIQELLRSDTIEFLEKPFLPADPAESLTRLTVSR